MMSKTKNDQRPRLGSIPFLSIWLAAHGVGWGVIFAIWEIWGQPVPDWQWYLMIGLLPGMIIAATQRWLLRYAHRVDMRGWLVISAVGWSLGGISLSLIRNTDSMFIYLSGLFVLPAVLQWLILRRYVNNAWIWVIAAIASTALFTIPGDSDYATWQTILAAAGLQGAVTGMSLLWLLGNRAAQEQPKIEVTQQQLERLEAKIFEPHWTDDLLQQENVTHLSE